MVSVLSRKGTRDVRRITRPRMARFYPGSTGKLLRCTQCGWRKRVGNPDVHIAIAYHRELECPSRADRTRALDRPPTPWRGRWIAR